MHFQIFEELVNRTFKMFEFYVTANQSWGISFLFDSLKFVQFMGVVISCGSSFMSPSNTELPIKAEELVFYLIL